MSDDQPLDDLGYTVHQGKQVPWQQGPVAFNEPGTPDNWNLLYVRRWWDSNMEHWAWRLGFQGLLADGNRYWLDWQGRRHVRVPKWLARRAYRGHLSA